MTTRRVFAVLAAVAAFVVLTLRAATAVPPAVTAWWSAANTGPATFPAPPDVGQGDLLVQGVAVVPGLPDDRPAYQALAALRYPLALGDVAGTLVLELRSATDGAAVDACRVTAEFANAANGPWADVPPFDCSERVKGVVDAAARTVTFADVNPLNKGAGVAVMIVPTTPGRLVFAPPGEGSLAVTSTGPTSSSELPPIDSSAFAVAAIPPVFAGGELPPTFGPTTFDATVVPPATDASAVVTAPATSSEAVIPAASFPDAGAAHPGAAVVLVLFVGLVPIVLRGNLKRPSEV